MDTMTTQELVERVESGRVAVFDVRGDVEFEKGHIPHAGSAPLGSLVFRVASVMNPDSEVVVYSGGRDCPLAAEAVERLENLGLRNVRCYEDGLVGWRAAGLPVVPSVSAKVHTHGPVTECRAVVVDRKQAYGGVFSQPPVEVGGAGG